MDTFETLPDLAAVDAAQGRMNAKGDARLYTIDPRFRQHVETERVRLMAGEAPPTPAAPSLAGVTGVDDLGRRQHLGGEPDSRMLELARSLAARVGPDGRRLVDSQRGYRERVEASFAEAMAGARWSPAAEQLAGELADEAKNQAADSGLYSGIERQEGFTFDRTDPLFQSAAQTAQEAGLSDKQFAAVLNWHRANMGGE